MSYAWEAYAKGCYELAVSKISDKMMLRARPASRKGVTLTPCPLTKQRNLSEVFMQKIITRSEAIEQGLKRYFTGKPCKRGHVDKRWTCSSKCFSCHYEDNPVKGFYGKGKKHKKELAKARAKKWYKNNKAITIKRASNWKRENPDRVKELSKAEGKRLRSTPEGKCIVFMRDSLRRCLKNKKDRTSKILGYTKDDLAQHIERQFLRGMSWSNYGEWHIDHIVPVSWYVKNGETDPRVINALTNLRPMWARDNNSKGSRRDVLI